MAMLFRYFIIILLFLPLRLFSQALLHEDRAESFIQALIAESDTLKNFVAAQITDVGIHIAVDEERFHSG